LKSQYPQGIHVNNYILVQ